MVDYPKKYSPWYKPVLLTGNYHDWEEYEGAYYGPAYKCPVVLGLHWKRGTRAGALALMVGGLSTCLVASILGRPYFMGLDPAEAGVLVSAIPFVGVSAVTRPLAEDKLRVFFPARGG